ncbi:MAG: nuclear transport factor 2 family protein [Acidobacteriota bacterium]|nr:MAG: nuclear transport factor 2 family protein [Acidobacteriota bacterium]
MKSIVLAVPLLFLASVPSGCETGSEVEGREPSVIVIDQFIGPEEELSLLRAAGDKLVEAFLKEDLDVLMEGFTEDAVLIPEGQPILKGKGAIRVHYRTVFDEFEVLEFGPTLDEAIIVGDWAYTRGTASILACRDNSHDDDHRFRQFSRGMEIWRKQGDTWLIARAIGNH